jgi:hypothetical protein
VPWAALWLDAWVVTAVLLLVTGAAFVARFSGLESAAFGSDRQRYRVLALLALLGVLLAVASRSRSPDYLGGPGRNGAPAVVFLALTGVCVLAGDPLEYTALQWVVISGVLAVGGIFFYHSLSVPQATVRSRHPVWAGFVLAVGLVVLPQYVSRSAFLWALTRVTALLVVLTLPVYVVGEYTLFGLSFGFTVASAIPLDVPATRSLFYHRNAFGVVAFAGFVSAVVEPHRSVVREPSSRAVRFSALLLAVNGLGLTLSFARALWVITPMAVGVYLASVVYGREALPLAVAGGFAYLVSGIAAVQAGLVPLPEATPTRVDRWYPAMAAIADQPSVLGEGLIDPGAFYATYQGGAGYSPHNSDLTVVIHTGFLGGLASLVTVALGLVAGLTEAADVDVEARVGLLALGVGFTAHQLFEAYTLFNWNSSAVVAVLVYGLLAFGARAPSSASSGASYRLAVVCGRFQLRSAGSRSRSDVRGLAFQDEQLSVAGDDDLTAGVVETHLRGAGRPRLEGPLDGFGIDGVEKRW